MPPETRYAKSGDVEIAFQTVGDGSIDVIWVGGFATHLEILWDEWDKAMVDIDTSWGHGDMMWYIAPSTEGDLQVRD